MPYYEVLVDRPFAVVSSGHADEYAQVWDRPISFVEKLNIGPRRFLLFGGRPIEFEVFSHDIAILRIRREVELIVKLHQEPEKKTFRVGQRNIPFLDFSDGDQIRAVRFSKGQEVAVYKASFYLKGRSDQQIRWSGNVEGYGDFFDELCSREVERALMPIQVADERGRGQKIKQVSLPKSSIDP